MGNFENLSTDELVAVAKNGTAKEREMAMELLVERNDNLILHLINRHFHSYRYRYSDDMRQEGRKALFEQATRYDPSRGTFSTFISPYIIDAIKVYICGVHGISTHYSSQMKKYRQAIEKLRTRGIENPSYGDIAEEMGVGLDAVQRVHDVCCRVNPISIEGDNKDKELCSPYDSSPSEICERDETHERITKALMDLPKAERDVIREMFYNSNKRDTPMNEIAARLGTDVSTVRRLRNLALRRLKDSHWLSDFDTSKKQRQMDDFSQSLTITFTMPAALVEANVDIALSLASDNELSI